MSNSIRMIDKNETVADIEIEFCSRCDNDDGIRCQYCDIATCIDIIQWQPTVEKTINIGHWIIDEDGNGHCSECGNTDSGGNYCSRCGVKMK